MKSDPSANSVVDITPTPRILRTLGDIPFSVWQCLAELIDNALDSFSDAEKTGKAISSPRVDIHWSNDSVPKKDREIVVEDNGLGMSLETLQKAAKAGYSSNDPIHTLGLFGMGFNIATARLGDETVFLSTTTDSDEWVGVKISFEQLIRDQTFSAPVVREPKRHSEESGTRILVRKIKDGVFSEIRRKESSIRRRLESIYTPILNKNTVLVFTRGKQLSPNPHCVWSESRFVVRRGVKVGAIQHINRDLGETYFDEHRNRYLTEDESIELDISNSDGGMIPGNIVKRSRRLKGWIGIQRYCNTSEFGIDFVRNGRKILVSDKVLFGYENADTGAFVTEYPVELGSTIGGRIVGELHVDYLVPTYQKNGFDTTDRAWQLTVDAVRGAGPILPKQRKALGYDGENESPLGKLVNAYRRVDPGTKNLAIPNSIAKEFARRFSSREPDYETDEKWYKVAQEKDREKGEGDGGLTPVNTGDTPSDDVTSYGPDSVDEGTDSTSVSTPSTDSVPLTSDRDYLIQCSEKAESLTGKYSYNLNSSFDVTAWRLSDGQIKANGERVPYLFFQDGFEIDFFYDLTHPTLAEYPITPKQLLLHGLSEKFTLRDTGVSFQTVFLGLVDNHLTEEWINPQALQERAFAIVSEIRERLPRLLGHRFGEVKNTIRIVEAEEEHLANRLLDEAPQLLKAYQDGGEQAIQTLAFVGETSIKRIIQTFPEEFLDSKLFSQPYLELSIGSESLNERLRENSVERVLSYFSDVVLLLHSGKAQNKHELLRHSNTLTILEGLIVS